jgi:hypothetical protein
MGDNSDAGNGRGGKYGKEKDEWKTEIPSFFRWHLPQKRLYRFSSYPTGKHPLPKASRG